MPTMSALVNYPAQRTTEWQTPASLGGVTKMQNSPKLNIIKQQSSLRAARVYVHTFVYNCSTQNSVKQCWSLILHTITIALSEGRGNLCTVFEIQHKFHISGLWTCNSRLWATLCITFLDSHTPLFSQWEFHNIVKPQNSRFTLPHLLAVNFEYGGLELGMPTLNSK